MNHYLGLTCELLGVDPAGVVVQTLQEENGGAVEGLLCGCADRLLRATVMDVLPTMLGAGDRRTHIDFLRNHVYYELKIH